MHGKFEPHYYAFEQPRTFLPDVEGKEEVTFYDSVTSKPLFTAPKGRTMEEFLLESKRLGYLSFREEEVEWSNV